MRRTKLAIYAVLSIFSISFLYIYFGYFRFFNPTGLPIHELQNLILENKLHTGHRPFSSKSITKVCFILESYDLREHGLDYNKEYYGYMAIIEYDKHSYKLGFVSTDLLNHNFKLGYGMGFCSHRPRDIVVEKRDIWLLTDGEQ